MSLLELKVIKTIVDKHISTQKGILIELDDFVVNLVNGEHFSEDIGIKSEMIVAFASIMGKLGYVVTHSYGPSKGKQPAQSIDEMIYASPGRRRGDAGVNKVIRDVAKHRRDQTTRAQIYGGSDNQVIQRLAYGRGSAKVPDDSASEVEGGFTKMIFKKVIRAPAPTHTPASAPVPVSILQPAITLPQGMSFSSAPLPVGSPVPPVPVPVVRQSFPVPPVPVVRHLRGGSNDPDNMPSRGSKLYNRCLIRIPR